MVISVHTWSAFYQAALHTCNEYVAMRYGVDANKLKPYTNMFYFLYKQNATYTDKKYRYVECCPPISEMTHIVLDVMYESEVMLTSKVVLSTEYRWLNLVAVIDESLSLVQVLDTIGVFNSVSLLNLELE